MAVNKDSLGGAFVGGLITAIAAGVVSSYRESGAYATQIIRVDQVHAADISRIDQLRAADRESQGKTDVRQDTSITALLDFGGDIKVLESKVAGMNETMRRIELLLTEKRAAADAGAYEWVKGVRMEDVP